MGFSVSGSVAIITIGVLVAFGVMFPTVMDSSHQLSEAQASQSDRILEQQNTEIRINDSNYDGTNLTVTIVNDGTSTLAVDETDVIVDGQYTRSNDTTVYSSLNSTGGDGATNVWLSGEVLEIVVEYDTNPDRVKVVTTNGVSDIIRGSAI